MSYAMNRVCAVADKLPPDVRDELRYTEVRWVADKLREDTTDEQIARKLTTVAGQASWETK